jgi:hypothetical protein
VVTQAFAEARPGLHAFGAAQFVERWLDPSGAAPQPGHEGAWETLLLMQTPALKMLLTASLPLAPDGPRVGVFSERAWLKAHPTISARGAAMASTLFQVVAGVSPEVDGVAADPTSTDRASLEAAVAPSQCQACHRVFDPLGYALGHFDELGDYRELDDELPIDATGSLALVEPEIQYDGVKQLGEQLVDTCEANVGLADGFLKAALSINQVSETRSAELFAVSAPRVRQAFVQSERRSYEDLVRSYAQSPAGISPQ